MSPTSSRDGAHRAAWRRLPFLALTVAVLCGSANCAEERPPISRVQEGAVKKSWLVGDNYTDGRDDPEFYMENFVVDGPADQSMMPVGTYDDVDRIRWEVQENVLLARKAYEYVTGSDGRGLPARTQTGIVVAAYRIQTHFDIRNDYNPTTGEPSNVVGENTSDRRWYDRDYMRVDWSRNLVDNPDWSWVFYGQLFGDLSFSPVAWFENNPRSPNASNFCEIEPGKVRDESGNCVAAPETDAALRASRHPGGYFDITSKWLVQPEMSDFFGEPLPTCLVANFFSNGPVHSCNPQEAVIRTAFRRVADRDFEPLELTVAPYDLVGGPRADRNGWDPGYGINDRNFHRYAMIHNIWMQSHVAPVVACTSNDDADNNGTADQCPAAHPGSQCDLVMQKCTLPYRERRVRPVAYYVNEQMPPEMQDHVVVPGANGSETYRLPTDQDPAASVTRGPSEDIIDSWNFALMASVANAREVECRRTGGARDACHGMYFENRNIPQGDGAFLGPQAKGDRVVFLCHNPVRAGDDPSACREPGFRYRIGDLRYHHITYWPGNSRAPFGGIAHWGYDPLTGEIVSNGGFNMGRSVEAAAAQQRDFILMALGELDVNDYVEGAATDRFSRVLRNPAGEANHAYTDAELEERVGAVDPGAAARSNGYVGARQSNLERAVANHDRVTQDLSNPVSPQSTQTARRVEALSQQLRNTTLEADMIDEHWLANLGFDPGSERTQSFLNQVSPLRNMDPERAEQSWTTLMGRLERRGFCFQDAGAPAVVGSQDIQGVARWFKSRYPTLTPDQFARRVLHVLRQEAYKGIALHEIGHSMGLYHLPVSSYDSMNYNPQYWQLRTNNGNAEASRTCTPVCTASDCRNIRNTGDARNNDNCMGPRYLDEYTDEELGVRPQEAGNHHAGINYFGNTSTMEYQWERFGETVGIGSYDHYATGILYGRVLETMEPDPARGGFAPADQDRFSARLRTQLGELDQISWRDPVLESNGVLPIHYTELARQMRIFDPARCRPATDAEKERYRWRVVNGQLCDRAPRDHASLTDFESGTTSVTSDRVAPSWRTRAGARTGENVLRWGYRVAWDIGTGYPHINYFDQGADLYEVTRSMIQKYDLSYPSQYFRRGSREFTGFNIPAYLARVIFRRLRGYHWSVARDVAYYGSAFSDATYARVARDDNWLRPYLISGTDIFDFFAGVLLRPEPGDYGVRPDPLPNTRALFDVPEDGADDPMLQFTVGVIDGRFIGEEYDNARGGSWDYHSYLRRAGAYPEKPLAAIMLTDTRPTFSSITRSLFLDGREFQVNFGTDMPQAFNRLLGGILAEDWDTVAPHVPTVSGGGTGGLPELSPRILPLWTQPSRTNPQGMPTRPAGSRLLFPNIGYRQQLPTAVYTMLFSSLNSDLSTVHATRIWTEGGPEQVDVPDGDRVRFRNPESGIVYVARRYGPDLVDNKEVDRGIASRMIAHANELLVDTYQVEVDDRLRPIYDADGSVRVVFNAATRQPVPAHPTDARRQNEAQIRFRNYVGLVDATRYASRLLGYGLLR
ncbi:MAG: hypothetical protein U0324_22535 [Polyangiales bacterium]